MGRRAKYATLTKYQPYIDIIRADLAIPSDVIVDVSFVRFVGQSGGYAKFSPSTNAGIIKLNKTASHAWTIRALMHEFQHIKDYYTGRMKDVLVKARKYSHWQTEWDTVLYKHYSPSVNKAITAKYENSPWEVVARNYEKEATRLFPNDALPVKTKKREYIGTSSGTKFYKVSKWN